MEKQKLVLGSGGSIVSCMYGASEKQACQKRFSLHESRLIYKTLPYHVFTISIRVGVML